jgi:hypothetical protein
MQDQLIDVLCKKIPAKDVLEVIFPLQPTSSIRVCVCVYLCVCSFVCVLVCQGMCVCVCACSCVCQGTEGCPSGYPPATANFLYTHIAYIACVCVCLFVYYCKKMRAKDVLEVGCELPATANFVYIYLERTWRDCT